VAYFVTRGHNHTGTTKGTNDMLSTRHNSRLIKRQRLSLLALAATMVLAALVAIPMLAQAKDPISYTIVFGHTDGTTTTVSGVTTQNDTFIAEAGGTDADNPTGMIMHLSCSDKFPDGWGEKQGPDPILDSEWQVVSYFIDKGDKTCGTPPPPPQPSIDLEKATNGEDADDPTGPEISVGGDVEWTFVVTNTGDIDLYDITLIDSETMPAAGSAVTISCPRDTLAPGESMTCTATGTAIEGQYANLAKVTGTALVSGTGDMPPPGVTREGKYAVVTFVDPATGDRTTLIIEIDTNDTYVPDAGGTSQDDPIGMVMHLSCSDKYADGWGEKQGPDPVIDSAWKVEDFWIFEIKKDDEVKTKCGEPVPIEKMVMDTDPSHYIGVPGDPAVDIEKHTNGEDADLPTGPELFAGDEVTWSYIVTNTGDVDLFDIEVNDDKEGFIGTIPFLAPGDSETLEFTGIALEGQYANEACAKAYDEVKKVVDDCDPSHYLGLKPAIDIEKATNGFDADDPTGPEIPVGGAVTWTYVITNTGDVDLFDIRVRDDKEGLIEIIDFLAVGDSTTVEAAGIAIEGQYANDSCAVGYTEERDRVSDCDPSHYFGKTPEEPDVDIEKHTNGEDADLPPGPTLQPGDTVIWEYIVTNTGSVDLFDLNVSDDKEGFIGTIPFLAAGDSKTLIHTGIARPGQYANEGCVVGKSAAGVEVEDCDPSHYDPPGYDEPAIDIEKATNGEDADDPTGPSIPSGDTVEWTYVVINTGAEPLWGVFVYDEQEGHITCPERFLAVGESMTCTQYGTAVEGQYANEAWVTGWGYNQLVTDADRSHYYGGSGGYDELAIDLEKATNGEDADFPQGPQIETGATVTWTYVVTNTGAEPLWGIYLFDEEEGHISCPARFLAVGDSMTCTATGIAESGQYANEAWVTGWGYTGQASDTDWSHYYGYGY